MHRQLVWYVRDSAAGEMLAGLPEDLEPCVAGGQLPSADPDASGVLVVDPADGEKNAAAMAAARHAGLPVVALIRPDSVPWEASGPPCYAYLDPAVPSSTLVQVLRGACEHARAAAEIREMSLQLEDLSAIGIRLSAERDLDALLELILTKGREITRSDAGSLYVVETAPDGTKRLRFKMAQNDSVQVPFTESTLAISAKSVAGYVALSGEILRIDDVYALPRESPFHINAEFDAHIGYRTMSMLVVPMTTADGEIIGVLQLINCKREAGRPLAFPVTLGKQVLPFPERYQNLVVSLASQAGVAIQNAQLLVELRAALKELEASQQLIVQAERLSALGEMAAGVAHDFNNLLAVVVGRAELLLRAGQAPAVSRDIQIIRQAAWDGAQTVRRIQEFTRTRQTRPAGRVDILELLRDVVELTRGRWKDEAQSLGVSYEVRVEGTSPLPVSGISAELREVFMNLLMNALDAMPEGGQFVFHVSTEGEMVKVAAADTGCGMSEETRRRVLEPFFTTKGARGNGLGLAVSFGIVKRHEGTIEIESRLGSGSTFIVRLPVSKGEEPAPVQESLPSVARRGHVLVVDDEAEIRSVLRDILTSAGHTVVEAANGEEALVRCENEVVDVILADISMPGMSGWDVAAACRHRFPHVPLGFVTGWGDRLNPEETKRSGVRFVLSKPFAPADVQAVVADALGAPAGR